MDRRGWGLYAHVEVIVGNSLMEEEILTRSYDDTNSTFQVASTICTEARSTYTTNRNSPQVEKICEMWPELKVHGTNLQLRTPWHSCARPQRRSECGPS